MNIFENAGNKKSFVVYQCRKLTDFRFPRFSTQNDSKGSLLARQSTLNYAQYLFSYANTKVYLFS